MDNNKKNNVSENESGRESKEEEKVEKRKVIIPFNVSTFFVVLKYVHELISIYSLYRYKININ